MSEIDGEYAYAKWGTATTTLFAQLPARSVFIFEK